MNKKKLYIIVGAAILVVIILFLLFLTEIAGLFRDDSAVVLKIEEGSTKMQIGEQLKDEGIVGSKYLFVLYSKITKKTYHSGIHEFKSKSYAAIAKELSSHGGVATISITVTEGMEQREIAELFESKGLVTAEEFNNAAKIENYDYWFLKDIKKRDMQLEGYLYPDTYEFTYNDDAETIIRKMLDNFEAKFTADMKKRADELGMSVDEIVTLASIVEREAASKDELPLVAGVFHNRLDSTKEPRGYLQSCATVQYILKERKIILSIEDTNIESDYNTYLNKGLPVGPIASPGMNSIKTALYPEDTDYLYFVADGQGKHYFAENYTKHKENMKKAGLS